MRAYTKYYFVILTLLRLKNELHRVKSTKLQPLIELLNTKSIEWFDGSEVVPTNNEIAGELGCKLAKCNSMLKELFEKLFEDFENSPLELTKVVHKVIIMYDEEEYKKRMNNPNFTETSLFIELQLKETPRIGEQIEFEVVPSHNIARGTVHDIRHIIEGKTQYIEIRCHPYRNRYANWMKMKEEYEERQLQLRWVEYMSRNK